MADAFVRLLGPGLAEIDPLVVQKGILRIVRLKDVWQAWHLP